MFMMDVALLDSSLFNYLVLPFLIFFARVADVTLGTMRIILVSKGKKYLAPIFGFFEVFIWIVAISSIMQNLDNYFNYFAYAGGFAAGNFIGMYIEEKIAMGVMIVRVITQKPANVLIDKLNYLGYGVTAVDARGAKEDVSIIYTVIHRNELKRVIEIIKHYNPRAFFSVEDVRYVNEGVFPIRRSLLGKVPNGSAFRRWRKGK
jgi:uncharacterized protein YebE (UPF0316 family)